MKASRWLFGIVWVIALVLGGIGVVERFLDGHRLAGYTSYVPWGLWVAAYIYFVGISAGALLIANLFYVFRVEPLQRVARLALFVATSTFVMALLSIWFDLGHLERFYFVFTRPHFTSVLAWMVWLYALYFLVVLAETFYAVRGYRARVKTLGIAATVLAIVVPGGGGALFGTLAAREYWHSGLNPILFVVGGMVSGAALVTAVGALFAPVRDAVWSYAVKLLGRITLGLVLTDLVLEWAEFSIPMWYRIGPGYELTKVVLFGSHWYVFWIVHLLLGVAVPLALLLLAPASTPAVGWSGALVALSFFAVRLNLVIPGLITPQLAQLETAYITQRLSYQYTPTLFEWQVTLFAVAVGIGLFYLAYRYIPLVSDSQEY